MALLQDTTSGNVGQGQFSDGLVYPVVYVLELFDKGLIPQVTPSAAHLALVMAASCLKAVDGEWWTFRATESLCRRMGVSPRSIPRARAELFHVGLFDGDSRREWRAVTTADGTKRKIAPGVLLARLVYRTDEQWKRSGVRGFRTIRTDVGSAKPWASKRASNLVRADDPADDDRDQLPGEE